MPEYVPIREFDNYIESARADSKLTRKEISKLIDITQSFINEQREKNVRCEFEGEEHGRQIERLAGRQEEIEKDAAAEVWDDPGKFKLP